MLPQAQASRPELWHLFSHNSLLYGPAPVPATSRANGTSPGSNPPVRSGLKEDLEVMRDNVIVELERKLDLNSGSPTPV